MSVGNINNPSPSIMPQYLDAGNSTTYTASAALYTGAWTLTREVGVVRQLVVLASTVPSGLGGTFTFEYSEDGITATISEARTIGDFAMVRDFDLINAGAYFRVKFLPSRAVTGAEFIFINTTQRTQNDGQFVRLADQEIERANAALGGMFNYLKGFKSNGKSVNALMTDEGNLIGAEFYAEVARGTFSNWEVVNVTGTNPDVDTVANEDVWDGGGTWIQPTAARIHSIVSSSLLDIAAGTGARTIKIYGLDASYLEISETITMNGIIPVLTVNSYIMINYIEVLTAGVLTWNDGTITAIALVDLTVTAQINAQNNNTLSTIYQVPANKNALIIRDGSAMQQASATNGVNVVFQIKKFGFVFNIIGTKLLNNSGTSFANTDLPTPLLAPAKSIIKKRARNATANNNTVTSSYTLIMKMI